MIAAVHHGSKLVAVQRTFLAPGHPIRARDLSIPRRMLGRPLAGAVQLAPAGDIMGLAEGTETAMSAMTLLGIGVWATLGAGRLHRIALPVGISRLVLLPDNDHAGQAAAAKALETYRTQGRSIEVLWPPAGCKDWNDALRKGEEGVAKIGDGQPEWTGCSARSP
ncbi:toprim domain-containing protein [Novosphingobium sp. SG707]|uniref:toprim domain-containing protein n=1 Tax=Novosphingobium sp. SG707 TaxID=2586996 RepID=UPI001FF0C3B7|nr:toprim domain-containing protein [Novosphingobium sp. SG707]